ncbi:MAG: hypothetical protein HQ567_04055, partial [Candidatus Nealsonbacteria bacterium]|nr:hypothetical protein [Candidatus Nealsonbacteria bacterium]
MTGSFKFEQVGPDGELKHGKVDQQKFGQKADTHGIMFALTRQMIIDDDLSALSEIPRQIGMGAAEAIADQRDIAAVHTAQQQAFYLSADRCHA